MVRRLCAQTPLKRTLIVWLLFMAAQWIVFLVGFLSHRDAWVAVQTSVPDTGVSSSVFILGNNLLVIGLIAGGNLFARFGNLSLGGLILLIQGVTIGWTAGTNSFQFPFPSLAEANINYLKIGLWEVSAYAAICGVTMSKSMNIAETFPAKQWSVTRKFGDLQWDTQEKALLAVGLLFLVFAASIEGFFI